MLIAAFVLALVTQQADSNPTAEQASPSFDSQAGVMAVCRPENETDGSSFVLSFWGDAKNSTVKIYRSGTKLFPFVREFTLGNGMVMTMKSPRKTDGEVFLVVAGYGKIEGKKTQIYIMDLTKNRKLSQLRPAIYQNDEKREFVCSVRGRASKDDIPS